MRVLVFCLAALAALAAFWMVARDLVPPKTLRFAAGAEGGGYWQIATQYQAILARDGIAVEILETAGSGENAALLAEGAADVALVQGGIAVDGPVEALAAVVPEPLWVFARTDTLPANPASWSGRRLAVGPEGSGTRLAAEQFVRAVGLPPGAVTFSTERGDAAEAALMAGTLDAVLFVAPLDAPYLRAFLQNGAFTLLELEHLDAIVGRMDHAGRVVLPSGGIQLVGLQPPVDVDLIALNARLVAQDSLHPSLVDRLIEAAKEIHSGRSVIAKDEAFPTTSGLRLPVDVYASDLLRNGTSSLQAFLPYWIVAQINRVAILLLPILILLLPLLRLLPGLYAWRMRHRVFRHYDDIREIDIALSDADRATLRDLTVQLDEIDRDLAAVRLPLPYRDYAYTARLHVELLRRRIEERLN